MAINKEFLRTKVSQAILLNPYSCVVKRKGKDKYNQPKENVVITELTGLLYRNDKSVTVNIDNGGKTYDKEDYRFLVAYSDKSTLIKEGDILEVKVEGNVESYVVNHLGNTSEICFDMRIERV